MNVNKIIIKKEGFDNEPFFNIPLVMNTTPLDRTDAIQRDFVDTEIEKHIPEIEDNEVVRFAYRTAPILGGLQAEANKISFRVKLSENNVIQNTTLADIGLTFDDLKYRRNRFKKSFLRFDIFDSDDLATQVKIGSYTIFLSMLPEWFNNVNGVIQNVKEPNACNLKFVTNDPVRYTNYYSEGYFLYLPKKYSGESFETANTVYMRVSFNNAVTGISHRLGRATEAKPINELIDDIHIPCRLYKDSKKDYRYSFFETGLFITSNPEINLFECIAL